jgi:hypothetical protein
MPLNTLLKSTPVPNATSVLCHILLKALIFFKKKLIKKKRKKKKEKGGAILQGQRANKKRERVWPVGWFAYPHKAKAKN